MRASHVGGSGGGGDLRGSEIAGSPRWRQKLEHGGSVFGEHGRQVLGHRVRPEEIVIQSRVRVDSLIRIQSQ